MSFISKRRNFLTTVRLWFFSAAWVHLAIAAIVILPIDMSGDSDPQIGIYSRLKWRFITAWFNLINLVVYLPLCLYCEWKELRRKTAHVLIHIKPIRDILFTSILFPVITCADTVFWVLYWKDSSLIAPVSLFKYLPSWGQHSLHTISLVVVLADILVVPRCRPRSLILGLAVMTAFCIGYALTVYESYRKGDMVYLILEGISGFEATLLVMVSYCGCLCLFFCQWYVIDSIWGKPSYDEKRL